MQKHFRERIGRRTPRSTQYHRRLSLISPNNSAPCCCKLHDERSFPCTRLDVGLVLRNPVLVSEEPLSHSERSAESLRLPWLIDGSKRSTEHARGGEGGTTPSECLGSSHVCVSGSCSKDAPLRTERAFKAY